MYLTFKTIHMTCALISFTGFLLRAYLMFIDSPFLKHKAVLIIPHLIDTVFLLSGFSMAFMVNFGLFTQIWLSMKILMLMLYLLCVGIALNRGSTKAVRVTAFFLAIFTFSYIVGIAINKTSLSWFGLLI
ncbi:SirB2 family protein [Gammaproteobacteria bacterium]|nr:SirB2 family protein [Gammaproteobacteria bacterium]